MREYNKIGIIAAMQIEIDSIKERLDGAVTTTVSGIDYVCGTLHGKQVIAAKSGVGKVFAAVCAQTMILRFSPDCIINTGVAGGLDTTLSVGDTVIGDATVQHDMDTSPLGDEVGMVSGIDIVYFPSSKEITKAICDGADELGLKYLVGTIACGDKFIASNADKAAIKGSFNAKACDMESAAISHVCYINGVPFGVIRAISDGAGDEAHMDFPTFVALAAERSTSLTEKFITLI